VRKKKAYILQLSPWRVGITYDIITHGVICSYNEGYLYWQQIILGNIGLLHELPFWLLMTWLSHCFF